MRAVHTHKARVYFRNTVSGRVTTFGKSTYAQSVLGRWRGICVSWQALQISQSRRRHPNRAETLNLETGSSISSRRPAVGVFVSLIKLMYAICSGFIKAVSPTRERREVKDLSVFISFFFLNLALNSRFQ